MDCQGVQDLFSAYLDGELPADRQTAVARHLAGCAVCRREFQVWQQVWEALGGDPVTAPADLTEKVLARLPGRPRSWWQNLALAASLLVGIFLGGHLGQEVYQTTLAIQTEAGETGWEGLAADSPHSLAAILANYDLDNGNGS